MWNLEKENLINKEETETSVKIKTKCEIVINIIEK